MKKTLLALMVAAFAAGSAQAYQFNIEETGTEIDFSGSLRLKWENINRKTERPTDTTKNISHGDIDNNGSRFGFKLKQNLGNDFYAVGRVEWRFRDNTGARGSAAEPNLASNRHNNFGHIYTRQLYAGFGHKTYGELVYGNMTTFTDEIKQTDLPNTYSLSDGLLNSAARRVVQYTNRGGVLPNLKFGAYYGATSPRDNQGLSIEPNNRNHVWGGGAVYKHNIDDLQDWTTAAGFSRETFANGRQVTAYSFGNAYRFDHTTLGLDLEHRNTANLSTSFGNGVKRAQYEARAVVFQELSEDWNAYAMYAYRHNKLKNTTVSAATEKRSEVMLGTEYYVYKNGSLKLKPFVEGKVVRVKNLANEQDVKQRDYAAVVGLRAYW